MIILFIMGIGLHRIKDKLSKSVLVFSSIYYILMLIATKKETWILIPLALIPLITAKLIKHSGIENRMAMAIWIVLAIFMLKTMYPPLTEILMSLIIGISYYLQIVTIFFDDNETYSGNNMLWRNFRERNPNIDFYNPDHFRHR